MTVARFLQSIVLQEVRINIKQKTPIAAVLVGFSPLPCASLKVC